MFPRTPRTLHRYVLSEIAAPFAGALVFFLFVLLMFQVINLVDFFVVHKVSAFKVVQLLGFLCLSLLQPAIPIAFLLAVLLGIGRLSTDGEILAMRASGISPRQLLRPVLAAGFALFLVSAGTNAYIAPKATRSFRQNLFQIGNTKAMATLRQGTFMEDFFDLMLYADEVDSGQNLLRRVFLYDSRDDASPTAVVARRGRILQRQEGADGTPGIVLRLSEGRLYRSSPVTRVVETIRFDGYDIFLALPTAKVVGVERPMTMDIRELAHRIQDLEGKPAKSESERRETRVLQMELWSRFSMAFACVIFAVLGTAFGTSRARSARSASFLTCLLVMLGYWQVRSAMLKYGEEGLVPPFLAAETANILLLLLALGAFRRSGR